MSTFASYNTLIEEKIGSTSELFFTTAMKRQAANDITREILQKYDVPEMTLRDTLNFANGQVEIPANFFRMIKLWDVDTSGIEDNEYQYAPSDLLDGLSLTDSYYWTDDYIELNAERRWRIRPAVAIATDNLILYYSFNEGAGTVADDDSANNNTGAISGATYTTAATGLSGTSLDFDGVNDFIQTTDVAAIQNAFDGGGSVSAWINADNDGENDDGNVVNKGAWFVSIREEVNSLVRIRFQHGFSGTNGIWTTTARIAATNEWINITITYNNGAVTNDPIVYVNGNSVAVTETQTPVGARTTDAGSDLFIGDLLASNRAFDGTIDEVRLYTDILTAAEVDAIARDLRIRYIRTPATMSDDATDNGLSAEWDETIAYGVAMKLFQISNRYDEAKEFERLFRGRLQDVYGALKNAGGIKQNNRLKSRYERTGLLTAKGAIR